MEDKKRKVVLYAHIKKAFGKKEMTARECAFVLYKKGVVAYPIRDSVAPRITELCHAGVMEVTGKKFDVITGKNVSKYKIVEEEVV